MDKTSSDVKGYNPEEVKDFLDQVIKKVEQMTNDSKEKDSKIKALQTKIDELSKYENEVSELRQKLEHYERMEATFNKAIVMAQKTSDQMRLSAHKESETIIDEAKKNANRIVNEALLKAEKIELESNMLTRNVRVFTKKVKDIIESQLEVIDDLDKIEM